jgi:hypothetical protein
VEKSLTDLVRLRRPMCGVALPRPPTDQMSWGCAPRPGYALNGLGQRPNRGHSPDDYSPPTARQSHAAHQAAKPLSGDQAADRTGQRGCSAQICVEAAQTKPGGENGRPAQSERPEQNAGALVKAARLHDTRSRTPRAAAELPLTLRDGVAA